MKNIDKLRGLGYLISIRSTTILTIMLSLMNNKN